MDNCSYPSRLIKSTWGDDYDIALYGRLGLYCHNFQQVSSFFKMVDCMILSFIKWLGFV